MKTKEFIKRNKELGYFVKENPCHFYIKDSGENIRAKIFKEVSNRLSLYTHDLEFIKLCLEYAETPISEREEEKKYRVRIPDSPERTNVFGLCKLVNGDICINSTNQYNFDKQERYILTESEIKRNHEYLWQFAKEVTP